MADPMYKINLRLPSATPHALNTITLEIAPETGVTISINECEQRAEIKLSDDYARRLAICILSQVKYKGEY